MHTARALTVSHSMLAGGGVSAWGVSAPGGWVSAPGGGGVHSGGVSAPGEGCLVSGGWGV